MLYFNISLIISHCSSSPSVTSSLSVGMTDLCSAFFLCFTLPHFGSLVQLLDPELCWIIHGPWLTQHMFLTAFVYNWSGNPFTLSSSAVWLLFLDERVFQTQIPLRSNPEVVSPPAWLLLTCFNTQGLTCSS